MNTFTGSRREQKEATRARILEVARVHFEAHGYEGANVRSIAEGAGVAVGTVLLHFADKRDLLHAALFEDLSEALSKALGAPSRGPLAARVRALFAPFFQYYASRPALSRALLRESLLAEPPWQARFAAQVAAAHEGLAGAFEAARARGEVGGDAEGHEARRFGAAVLAFFYFGLLGWAQGAVPDPAALVDALLEQHLRGVRPTLAPRAKARKRSKR